MDAGAPGGSGAPSALVVRAVEGGGQKARHGSHGVKGGGSEREAPGSDRSAGSTGRWGHRRAERPQQSRRMDEG